MATPPTRVLYSTPAVGFLSTATPKVTPTFDVVAGDLLTVIGTTAEVPVLGTPTSTGSITWTLRQSIAVTSYTKMYAWTGVVNTTATGITVSIASTGSGQWGFGLTVWRNHGGVGASAKTNVASGAPSLAITTAANSALVAGSSDYTATAGTSRVWRSVNGAAMVESAYATSGSTYTTYSGYSLDAGAAGAETVGLTAPAAQKYSIVAVEVLGISAANYTGTPSDAVGVQDSVTSVLVQPYFDTADWFWNAIPASPTLHSNSATWAGYLASGQHSLSLFDYSTAVVTPAQVDASTPRYDIALSNPYGASPADPFPSTIPVPTGIKVPPLTTSYGDPGDGHYAVADDTTNKVYALWQATPATNPRSASYGGIAELHGNGVDYAGDSTATGISRYAGVIRIAELQAAIASGGDLGHTLLFASDITTNTFVYPARKADGTNAGGVATPMPQGTRVQLNMTVAAINALSVTNAEKVILRTLAKYGAVCGDKGGARMSFVCELDQAATSSPGPAYSGMGLWDYMDMTGAASAWSNLRVLDPAVTPSPSGSSLASSPAEAIGVADVATDTLNANRAPGDIVGATDAATDSIDAVRAQADPVGLGDNLSENIDASRAAVDTVGVADGVTSELVHVDAAWQITDVTGDVTPIASLDRSVSDNIGIADTVGSVVGAAQTPTDTVGLTDAINVAASYSPVASDPIAVGDLATATADNARDSGDPVGVTDSVAVSIDTTRTIADTIAATDGQALDVGRSIADLTGVTDTTAAASGTVRGIADPVAVTDAATAQLAGAGAASLNDNAGLTDTPTATQAATRGLADTAGMTDSVAASTARATTPTDPVGVTDQVVASFAAVGSASPADAVGLTDAVLAVLERVVTVADLISVIDAATAEAAASRSVEFADDEPVTDTATWSASVNRFSVDAVGVTDSLDAILNRFAQLADQIGIDDTAANATAPPDDMQEGPTGFTGPTIQHLQFTGPTIARQQPGDATTERLSFTGPTITHHHFAGPVMDVLALTGPEIT